MAEKQSARQAGTVSFPALSLTISANWCVTISLAWLQAKSALARAALVSVAPSPCHRLAWSFLGKADEDRAPERRAMTEASTFLEANIGVEMLKMVIKCHHVPL